MLFPNIEAERARNGLSKTELCKELAITEKTLRNWQNGVSDIPTSKICRMAKIFQCSTDYLLNLDEK